MIGAGTIINPLIKVVTTVAILAAVYLLIVRPILDTTEEVTRQGFDAQRELQQGIQGSVRDSLRQAQKIAREAGAQVQVPEAAAASQAESHKLLRCVQNAEQDVTEIQACNTRFAP